MQIFPDMEIFTALNNHISYNFGYMCDMFFILSGFFFFFSLKKETSLSFCMFKNNKIASGANCLINRDNDIKQIY